MQANTNTTTRPTLLRATTEALADFGSSVLLPLVVPTLALGGLVALFVGPLWILARTLGVC
jgi:hypothetical protein